jgi:CheY-like chemotaxis protein
VRSALVVVATAAYVMLLWGLVPVLGRKVAAMSVLPVGVAAWSHGIRAGIVGGEITIRSRTDGEQVILEVSDAGVGMPEEVRRRSLEPFFSTKGEHGTGLGLAVVHGIVQRHEGSIDIESAPSKGTTFIIRLPSRGDTESAVVARLQEDSTIPRLRILVVHDEPVALEAVAQTLVLDGHIVSTASTGRQALEAFRRDGFEVVVTDRAMPNMNGDQVAAAIKRVDPHMQVIMLTGFGEMMETNEEVSDGVDSIVSKPITRAALRRELNRLRLAGVGV